MTAETQRVVVVANRLPVTLRRGPRGHERTHSVGGLVAAIEPVLTRRGGTWIGWPGLEVRSGETLSDPGDPYKLIAVRLTDREMSRYYHGFSNRTIWPLCHSLPERTIFRKADWETYNSINQRFAEAAVRETMPGDIVWVHDYHLMLTPRYIRDALPDNPLVFFFHIPFPPYEIFRLIPWDKKILDGLLACDLIGFHVDGYVRSFQECVERLVKVPVHYDTGEIEYQDRAVRVGAYPLGIDFEEFESLARCAERKHTEPAHQMALGVDRLDYTKGIPERIKAFELMLELYPEHRETVVLTQIAVPSRFDVPEYRELKRVIDEMVGRVNGRFATAGWSPIRYLFRSISREMLAGFYRDADVAVVTPLRDGMNLVAKEYIACQVDDPGVLVLSRFTGAAETMREAVRVNPYDIHGTASAIHQALTMELEERRSRLQLLRERERRNNVFQWADRILGDIEARSAATASHRSSSGHRASP